MDVSVYYAQDPTTSQFFKAFMKRPSIAGYETGSLKRKKLLRKIVCQSQFVEKQKFGRSLICSILDDKPEEDQDTLLARLTNTIKQLY